MQGLLTCKVTLFLLNLNEFLRFGSQFLLDFAKIEKIAIFAT